MDVRMVVLEGVARLAKGARPTAKWRGLWRQAIAPFSPEEVRAWARGKWEPVASGHEPEGDGEAMATAALWGAADVAAHGTAAQVGDVAWRLHRANRHHLARAAIESLAELASGEDEGLADEAIGQLQRLKGRIKHKTTAKQLHQALTKAAARRGLTAEALQDRVVEDAGLEPSGSRRWAAGAHDLYLFLSDDGDAELAVFDRASGRAMGAPPRAVREDHFAVLSEAKAVQKVVADSLATQKQRLEAALESQRAWTLPAWRRVFGTNPIMRHLARRLVWAVEDGPVVAFTGDGFIGPTHEAVTLPDEAVLRLAHPALLEPATLQAWQRHVVGKRLVQPFKQVFREVYRPTPEDLAIGRYSDRFAGQVVRHRQLYALLRGRGWSGLAGIGPTGYQGTKELPGQHVEAMIGFRQFRHYQDKARRQVILEQVEFYPHPLPEWEPGLERRLWVSELPRVAYSEVMRDLALVVGVAGLGHESAHSEDAAPAPARPIPLEGATEMRAALIRALLPSLGLEGHVTVEGAEAQVACGGQTFLLHLGSGQVHLAADGRHLDMEGIERSDTPLYMPHEGTDTATGAIVATLVWLAQYARYAQKG